MVGLTRRRIVSNTRTPGGLALTPNVFTTSSRVNPSEDGFTLTVFTTSSRVNPSEDGLTRTVFTTSSRVNPRVNTVLGLTSG